MISVLYPARRTHNRCLPNAATGWHHRAAPENPARQHRLRGTLGSREIGGKLLEQWQYEVTAGSRIWYSPDPTRRIVWVVKASTAHPKITE